MKVSKETFVVASISLDDEERQRLLRILGWFSCAAAPPEPRDYEFAKELKEKLTR